MSNNSPISQELPDSLEIRKPKNDVLYTSVQGPAIIKFLKRFYHDMLLISYSDRRAGHYLISSLAMARERTRHFSRYPGTIHPFSKFRSFWEHFMLYVCLCKQLVFSYNTTLYFNEVSVSIWCLGFFCEFFTMIDLLVSARTGYVDEESRQIILEPRLILINFCSTRLFFHVMGAIPLHGILYLRTIFNKPAVCSLCNSGIFVTIMRLFNTLSLVRSFDATLFLKRERSNFTLTMFSQFCRVVALAFMTAFWIWTMNNTVFALKIIVNNEVKELITTEKLVVWFSLDPTERPYFLCMVLFTISQFLFLNSVNLTKEFDTTEKMSRLVAFVSTNFYYIWAFMLMLDFLSQKIFPEDRMLVQVQRSVNMFQTRQLPDALTEKVKSYYHYSEAQALIIEKVNGLYEALPTALTNEIAKHCKGRQLIRVPYFVELPTNIMNEIVLLLQEEIYMSRDVVFKEGYKAEGMLLLDKGIVAVYAGTGEELQHLIDGDYLDVLSLFSENMFHANTVIAVSECKVLFLDKHRFRKLMKNYPDEFFKLSRKLLKANKSYAQDLGI